MQKQGFIVHESTLSFINQKVEGMLRAASAHPALATQGKGFSYAGISEGEINRVAPVVPAFGRDNRAARTRLPHYGINM